MNIHEQYMYQALIESRKALPFSSPNPNVGAVVVKNNKIIGKGHTQIPGRAHAEVKALRQAGKQAQDASLYVTLEPCCHTGRTAPCTDLIIQKKIKSVYIGISDPNPLVCHKGIKQLKKAGIQVSTHILEKEINDELQWYLKLHQKHLPYIILKSAVSLDGKITDCRNRSRWITSKKARQHSQVLREQNDGLIAGINTIRADDPRLTYRGKKQKFFYRIILDTSLKISLKAKVLKPAHNHYTIIAADNNSKDQKKIKALQKMKNVEILFCKIKQNKIDLKDLLKKLMLKNITRLIIEGGGEINYSFLKEKLVDKIILFISPKLFGGRESKNLIADGFPLDQAIKIKNGQFNNNFSDYFVFKGWINVYRNN